MEHKRTKSQILKHSLKNSFFLLFGFLLLSVNCQSLQAQSYTSVNKKAIKLYTEAQQAYNGYKLELAEELLRKSLEKDPKFVEAQTLIAYIFLDKNESEFAKTAFRKAIEINPTAIKNNFYFLAELELNDGNYIPAQKLFKQFVGMRGVDPKIITKANKGLDNIDFAIKAKANPYPFEPNNLGENINTDLAEYFPSLTVDQKTLLFTRRLPQPNTPQGFNEDFYISKKVNGKWQKATNLKEINTEYNEGAPTLSADGQLLIFTACELYGDYGPNRKGLGSCDLFYTNKIGTKWAKPTNLGRAINSNNWETQPSFSADGKTLYYVRGLRNRSGQRTGDIYTSHINSENFWTKPVKLNANINTPLNEESVFIHPDGKTLYFSSDGHLGMGGLDIFMSKLDDSTGQWGPAMNLGYPINTHKSENSILVAADGTTALFASNRDGGKGDLDLYSFNLPKNFAPNKVIYFAGKITDSKTSKPLSAKFELIDLVSKKVVVESYSDAVLGNFLVSLPSGRDYALNVAKEGYLFYSENFDLSERDTETPFIQDISLSPLAIGEKIILKNVFFETGKYDLKKVSTVELDKLIVFMANNPNLKIEISGHTDNEGNAANNLSLSKNRAKSVKDYLIKNGILESRLSSEGYGATKPLTDNTTAEGRAKNRRTEFEVSGM